MPPPTSQPQLLRTLSLPLLVFYGVGVTIGAGIFALIGEVIGLAGDRAPLAFLLAGLIAGFTGFAYALLAGQYPRAAGEAVFVSLGFGKLAGSLTGFAIVCVAITSSATIAVAFAGYLAAFLPVPAPLAILAILALLAFTAWLGVRESVVFAAIITLLEIGTLLTVTFVGLPHLDFSQAAGAFTPPASFTGASAVLAGAFVAFFAFIGFEDIENMAEETRDAHRNVPRAIILTLVISTAVYIFVALVATAFADRAGLVASPAPLAFLFQQWTGLSGTPVAAMATIAMINGVLVQIVMASRVLYGMGRDGMAPKILARLDAARHTPRNAITIVAALTALLALTVPLIGLARLTSFVMLVVFTAVNLSLFLIGRRADAAPVLRKWHLLGIVGALVSAALASAELLNTF